MCSLPDRLTATQLGNVEAEIPAPVSIYKSHCLSTVSYYIALRKSDMGWGEPSEFGGMENVFFLNPRKQLYKSLTRCQKASTQVSY